MIKLNASKEFRYKGRGLAVGDSFDALPAHAKVLTAIGKATVAPPASEDQTDEEPAKGNAAASKYRRRDLRAEE